MSKYNKCKYNYIYIYIEDLINNRKLLDVDKIEELQTNYIEVLSEIESDITKSNTKQNEKYINKYKSYLNEMKYIIIIYIHSFEIIEERMDGNCLFRCISRQMYNNNAEYHLLIRNKCVDYIEYNNEFYSPFIDMDFNEYCNNRRKSGIFGDDVELTALCQLYRRNIEIYTYDINNDYKPMILKTFTPDEISTYKSPIRLEYILYI